MEAKGHLYMMESASNYQSSISSAVVDIFSLTKTGPNTVYPSSSVSLSQPRYNFASTSLGNTAFFAGGFVAYVNKHLKIH